jgi:hypothetical protein
MDHPVKCRSHYLNFGCDSIKFVKSMWNVKKNCGHTWWLLCESGRTFFSLFRFGRALKVLSLFKIVVAQLQLVLDRWGNWSIILIQSNSYSHHIDISVWPSVHKFGFLLWFSMNVEDCTKFWDGLLLEADDTFSVITVVSKPWIIVCDHPSWWSSPDSNGV